MKLQQAKEALQKRLTQILVWLDLETLANLYESSVLDGSKSES
jgi:hypothetical protein